MEVVAVTNDLEQFGFKQLIRSLKHFNIGYEVINPQIGKEQAWARNYEYVYEWCKTQPPELEFLLTDGWDTFFVSGMDEIEEKYRKHNCKMLVSGEGVVFPSPHLGDGYDDSGSIWNYVNAGGLITTCGYFVHLIDRSCFMTMDGVYSFGKLQKINQQDWLAMMHLMFRKDIKIDTNCEIFQPLRRTFDDPPPMIGNNPDFEIKDKRLVNVVTGSTPIIIHGNGGIPLTEIYKLI